MQYYAVVNSGFVAVGTGLLTNANTIGATLLTGAVFMVGAVTAMIGIAAIHRGRTYYEATVFKKTLFEELLGLNTPVPRFKNTRATLAVATTEGMQGVAEIIAGKPRKAFFERLFRNRVVSYFTWLLMLLVLIDGAAVLYAASRVVKLSGNSVQTERLPSSNAEAITDVQSTKVTSESETEYQRLPKPHLAPARSEG